MQKIQKQSSVLTWNNPSSGPQRPCNSKLYMTVNRLVSQPLLSVARISPTIITFLILQPPRNKRQPLSPRLAHQHKLLPIPNLQYTLRQKVGNLSEIRHDRPVPGLSEPEELVVLSDDLHGRFREVEREGDLRGAEVVDCEEDFVREEGFGAPEGPSDTGVGETGGWGARGVSEPAMTAELR